MTARLMSALAVALLLSGGAAKADKFITYDQLQSGGTANASVSIPYGAGAGVLFTPDGGYPITLRAVDILVLPRNNVSNGSDIFTLNVWDESDGGTISPPPNIRGNRFDGSAVAYSLNASTSVLNRITLANPIVITSGRFFVGVTQVFDPPTGEVTLALDNADGVDGANHWYTANSGWAVMPDGGTGTLPIDQNWVLRAVTDFDPVVTAVSPDFGGNGGDVDVTISGNHFNGTSEVTFGTTPITVLARSTTAVYARVPAGFPLGVHDVTVTNSNGLSGTKPQAYTVTTGGGSGGGAGGGSGGGAGGGTGGGTGGGSGGGSGNGEDAGQSGDALVLESLTPQDAYNEEDTVITLIGSNFANDVVVFVGSAPMDSVVRRSPSVLSITIVKGFEAGLYDVEVVNPDGQRARLANALTVHQGFRTQPGGCGCSAETNALSLGLLFALAALRTRRRS